MSDKPEKKSPRQAPRTAELIFGKHSVRAVFENRPQDIKEIFILSELWEPDEEFMERAKTLGKEPVVLGLRDFVKRLKLTDRDKHGGVAIYAWPKRIYTESDIERLRKVKLMLLLDQVSNPQNFGTMIRNCAFFGADAIAWMRHRPVDMNATVYKVAVGAAEHVDQFKINNLKAFVKKLRAEEFAVYGLDERGKRTIWDVGFSEKRIALIVGAEGEGLRESTKAVCDELISIPGGTEGVESLNAGVSTAVALAAITRRRTEES